ncbi:hypothetical protein EYF80_016056 [Liparis tanakae]|uniref:Uncharacterized protein n=1 Tax=Liparis tanakae TaxID=230148 RepID=A0A4Z2I6K4_9TELE|nr:hypothetical protein EYF80_016056 [Liparis tanakae]
MKSGLAVRDWKTRSTWPQSRSSRPLTLAVPPPAGLGTGEDPERTRVDRQIAQAAAGDGGSG